MFCSKNPEPMLEHMDLVKPFHKYWSVTITPCGKEIEPNVPDKVHVIDIFRRLVQIVGPDRIRRRIMSGDQ